MNYYQSSLHGESVVIVPSLLANPYRVQHRKPRRKNKRIVARWKNNPKNYRMEKSVLQDSAIQMNGKIYATQEVVDSVRAKL